MRLYNLTDKSTIELKRLIDTVKAHTDLTVEEKKANIEAIESKLNSFNKSRPDVMKEILESQSDNINFD